MKRDWILLTAVHKKETFVLPEGDRFRHVIAPSAELKKGDTVYLWWRISPRFYAWGTVAEPPRDFEEPEDEASGRRKRRRQSVLVERRAIFPEITEAMMLGSPSVRGLVPAGFDDLEAVPLRPGQANSLNDFIRQNQSEAPSGSVTTRVIVPDNAPDIILQALLTFGDEVSEGRLVQAVRIPWYEILKMIARDPEEIFRIDPRKFEELIAGAYEREGFDEVILTPRSADKGRDIIATKKGVGSIRIFDQVKRYKISRPVTADEVRALVGVLTMDSNVSKGVITTTSRFAPTLLQDENIRRLVPYRLELRPREALLPWLDDLRLR